MKYVLVMNESEATLAERADPATAPAYWAAWTAYVRAIEETGMVTGGAGLQPPETAVVLRVRDGARQVQDGPFADSRERVGGFFVIDAPDLDTALAWAARSPAASGASVEVRPVLPPMPAA
jgi:hypothetical protein